MKDLTLQNNLLKAFFDPRSGKNGAVMGAAAKNAFRRLFWRVKSFLFKIFTLPFKFFFSLEYTLSLSFYLYNI